MNKFHTYDPEDIEKLLSSKSYSELLDEEREFVDQHIDSEMQYEQMRSLLHQVENQPWEDIPEPPSSLKSLLVKKHQQQHKKSFKIWLNGFFAMDTNHKWYQMPVVQMGFATVMIGILFFTLRQPTPTNNPLAVTEVPDNSMVQQVDKMRKESDPKSDTEISTANNETKDQTNHNAVQENLNDKTIEKSTQHPPSVPSPVVTIQAMEDTEDDMDISDIKVEIQEEIVLYDAEIVADEMEESEIEMEEISLSKKESPAPTKLKVERMEETTIAAEPQARLQEGYSDLIDIATTNAGTLIGNSNSMPLSANTSILQYLFEAY